MSSRVRELNGERMRRSARDVRAQSFLGVGAPEAVLVGVTALIVFGPKGLADVVKNAGKALRAFQPAIKELQEVRVHSFRSSIELNDINDMSDRFEKRGGGRDVYIYRKKAS